MIHTFKMTFMQDVYMSRIEADMIRTEIDGMMR